MSEASDLVSIEWIVAEIEKKVPRPDYEVRPPNDQEFVRLAMADDLRMRRIQNKICNALMQAGEAATLLRRKAPEKRLLDHGDLRYAVASRLKYGMFDPMDYHLREMHEWRDAKIYVSSRIAHEATRRIVISMAPPSDTGGRPRHPAFDWYAEKGFSREGRSIKELQAEMPRNDRGQPPSEATIRSWEKFRQKPPAETP